MRNDADEYNDREDEARFWRNYAANPRGGRCGIVAAIALLVGPVLAWLRWLL